MLCLIHVVSFDNFKAIIQIWRSLLTAGCLQRTFAGDSQLKYMDGIWAKKSMIKQYTDF